MKKQTINELISLYGAGIPLAEISDITNFSEIQILNAVRKTIYEWESMVWQIYSQEGMNYNFSKEAKELLKNAQHSGRNEN